MRELMVCQYLIDGRWFVIRTEAFRDVLRGQSYENVERLAGPFETESEASAARDRMLHAREMAALGDPNAEAAT